MIRSCNKSKYSPDHKVFLFLFIINNLTDIITVNKICYSLQWLYNLVYRVVCCDCFENSRLTNQLKCSTSYHISPHCSQLQIQTDSHQVENSSNYCSAQCIPLPGLACYRCARAQFVFKRNFARQNSVSFSVKTRHVNVSCGNWPQWRWRAWRKWRNLKPIQAAPQLPLAPYMHAALILIMHSGP